VQGSKARNKGGIWTGGLIRLGTQNDLKTIIGKKRQVYGIYFFIKLPNKVKSASLTVTKKIRQVHGFV
jgi:hypothetical protein